MSRIRKNDDPIQTLPILPLKSFVLFPQLFVPLSAGRSGSRAAIEAALRSEEKTIALFTQKDLKIEQPQDGDIYVVGTLAIIKKVTQTTEENVNLIVQGVERVVLLRLEQMQPYLVGRIRGYPIEKEGARTEIEALRRAVLDLATRIFHLSQPHTSLNITEIADQAGSPLHLAYLLASMLSLDTQNEQNILEAMSTTEALSLLYKYMNQEAQVLELRQKIATQAQSEMNRQQREYLLRQQLRAIQEELGEGNPEKVEIEELRKKISEVNLPEEVKKEAERELHRLEHLSLAAPDYQIIRTYLDFLLDLPWTKSTNDFIDLAIARRVLDEDHFDLQDIKNRILEHLAVLKLNPKAKAPIICLVGPPGVGKTSLGQSIARALGREFGRMSLGGLHDESELRGHRRTYIGAMPGRILQAIRRAGVNNPLLMFDEVDKIGRDFRGDPASALLEILDPAQNYGFRDNYLDLPFDLSRIFFITTANTLDTVPGPLLDRMETLRLSGYTEEEKFQIARRYLIPRRLSETGLKASELFIPDESLFSIIRNYTREAGVRDLERTIGRIASKVALQFAEGKSQAVNLKPADLSALLGSERFRTEKARQELPPGVAVGLAWTPTGGEVLYVESSLIPRSDELRLTGQLGDVMRESAKAAQTYLIAHAEEFGIDPSIFINTGVHIHVPSGAIPKDGPSAGTAMIASMASTFIKVPCRNDTAMTGEITLSGLVLPVGGVKEKVLAARRAGIRRIILPRDNEKDLQELTKQVQDEIEFILVDRIENVLTAILPDLKLPLRAIVA